MAAPDVLVIGAGVFGLWAARACLDRGLSVVVADRRGPGAGASGGLVGALGPHAPDRWRGLHRFQFDALTRMAGEIAALEAETGVQTGYRKSGRLAVLSTPGKRQTAEAQVTAAAERWAGHGRLQVIDQPPEALRAWLPQGRMLHGLAHDTLTAQIDPRKYIAALAADVGQRGELRSGWALTGFDRDGAVFDRGKIPAGRTVLAAGWESFALAHRAGGGVKGQSALLAATLPPEMPVLTGDGLYLVSHAPGRVAIGSTSEREWASLAPDDLIEPVVARARALIPALEDAPVIERWAGVRPRATNREPSVGPLPDRPGVILASGGFKIGLGIAHLIGRAVADMIAGEESTISLPESFAPSPR